MNTLIFASEAKSSTLPDKESNNLDSVKKGDAKAKTYGDKEVNKTDSDKNGKYFHATQSQKGTLFQRTSERTEKFSKIKRRSGSISPLVEDVPDVLDGNQGTNHRNSTCVSQEESDADTESHTKQNPIPDFFGKNRLPNLNDARSPTPDKQMISSSADLTDASLDETESTETDSFYENKGLRQDQEVQIQAMTEVSERLLALCTDKHSTIAIPDQGASKCPLEFFQNAQLIEICVDGLKRQIDDLKSEKNEYLNRLSSIAGARLTDNNPNITDLNDPKRPVKLAERLGKIYDDEWTDAMQDLEKKHSKKKEKKQEKIVYHLFSLIKVLYTTCKQKAELQVGHFLLLKDPSQDQVEVSWSFISADVRRSFNENRKKIAEANIEMLQEVIKDDDIYKKEIGSLFPPLDDKILNYLQDSPYFKKCLEICWYFVIQDPPLYLDILPLEGTELNKDTHKEYTKSGSIIKYVVWPALYLHCQNNEKGALLAKGVVQPKVPETLGAKHDEDTLDTKL
ncbi:unnamed protein product [Mytilus coruscus]|uniref:Mitochondria-eating protein C-terminal domain-containing protein n=1 Tax=Mytilus coruscus TaxID=42192 RepID=A0A6J8EKK0_MYTCO|nr:unnamed protein product [Mytilus coruscus]